MRPPVGSQEWKRKQQDTSLLSCDGKPMATGTRVKGRFEVFEGTILLLCKVSSALRAWMRDQEENNFRSSLEKILDGMEKNLEKVQLRTLEVF